jgi:hypothetical protein
MKRLALLALLIVAIGHLSAPECHAGGDLKHVAPAPPAAGDDDQPGKNVQAGPRGDTDPIRSDHRPLEVKPKHTAERQIGIPKLVLLRDLAAYLVLINPQRL